MGKRGKQKVINDQKRAAARTRADADSFTCNIHLPSEIIELILRHLPAAALLTSAQRVSRTWRDIVERMPEAFFADGQGPGRSAPKTGRTLNPLLERHFGQMFNRGREPLRLWLALPVREYAEWRNARHNLRDLTIRYPGRARQVCAARRLVAADAGLLAAVHELRYTNKTEDDREEEIVRFERGVRMGAFYDLVVEVVTKPRQDAYDAMQVLWPVMGEPWNCEVNTASLRDGPIFADADRDYVRVFKLLLGDDGDWCWGNRPCCKCSWCEMWYPLDMRAKYISSIRWAFKCEEGGPKNLVVSL
ncbi:hypothetical protein K4F52_005020 [Lecanicillium sp. MT-2017a]|nr:hypothetical protein K4F52_005020 [Lecanicillium sp. MT-2017a]